MKKKSITPKEIESSSSEWVDSIPETAARIQSKAQALAEVIKADKRPKNETLNMRIGGEDFENFKKLAQQKGIPYQTLLGHVIRLYAQGELVDVSELRKVFPFLKKNKAG